MQQNAFYEIHEDRIQKLESAVNDTNACLAQQSTKLDHLSQAVHTIKTDVHASMDRGLTDIKHEVSKTSTQINNLHTMVQDHGRRLEGIERTEVERSKTWGVVVKVVTFVGAAVVGAVIKVAVDSWLK